MALDAFRRSVPISSGDLYSAQSAKWAADSASLWSSLKLPTCGVRQTNSRKYNGTEVDNAPRSRRYKAGTIWYNPHMRRTRSAAMI